MQVAHSTHHAERTMAVAAPLARVRSPRALRIAVRRLFEASPARAAYLKSP